MRLIVPMIILVVAIVLVVGSPEIVLDRLLAHASAAPSPALLAHPQYTLAE